MQTTPLRSGISSEAQGQATSSAALAFMTLHKKSYLLQEIVAVGKTKMRDKALQALPQAESLDLEGKNILIQWPEMLAAATSMAALNASCLLLDIRKAILSASTSRYAPPADDLKFRSEPSRCPEKVTSVNLCISKSFSLASLLA